MNKPNIVLLLIDSLRADKFFGPEKSSITPNIDKMINHGTYFDQAISSSDATLLSWASLFTGKYAFKTGIKSDRYNKLDDSIVTYFTIFQKGGYHLYSYLPYLSTMIGLFPQFENQDSVKKSGRYSLGKDLSDGLGDQIINLLSSNKMKEPWFYYIHINDLHYPISVPDKFSDKKFGLTKYDQQMSSIDNWIGKFLQVIDLNKTLIVLMSDHGIFIPNITNDKTNISFEIDAKKQQTVTSFSKHIPKFLNPLKTKIFFSLEEKQNLKKVSLVKKLNLKPHEERNLLWYRGDLDKVLFDDNVHVPLLFYGPNIKSQIISQQIGLIDLMPTICELVNVNDDISENDGKSFVSLIEGKKMEELPIFLETSQLIQKKANVVIGIRTSRYKYFRDSEDSSKRVHLFDLKIDSFENNNIAKKFPEIVSKMEYILETQFFKNKNKSKKEPNQNDTKKIEDELKKWGYM